MEHTKKMVLVSPDVIQRLSKPSQSDTLSMLDNDMSQILNEKIDDRKKWLQYSQVLNRYLHFAEEERKPLLLPIMREKSSKVNTATQFNTTYQAAVGTLPKTLKQNGEILLNKLMNSNFLKWDNNGVVTIHGTELPNTNMVDLINDTMRNRSKMAGPQGWKAFTELLYEINVPLELIGNKHRVAYLKNLQSKGASNTSDAQSDNCYREYDGDVEYAASKSLNTSTGNQRWEPFNF